MLLLSARKEAVIRAQPQAIFDVVSDVTRHNELAGSGEVLRVRKITEGPVGIGTRFEADEDIRMGPQRMKFVATSQIVSYNPPSSISWTSSPVIKPKPKRIQWWFDLTPQGDSTRVTHRVEVEFGFLFNLFMKVPYRLMRGGKIKKAWPRPWRISARRLKSVDLWSGVR